MLLVSEKWKMLTKPRQKLLVSSEARQFGSRQFGGLGVDEISSGKQNFHEKAEVLNHFERKECNQVKNQGRIWM